MDQAAQRVVFEQAPAHVCDAVAKVNLILGDGVEHRGRDVDPHRLQIGTDGIGIGQIVGGVMGLVVDDHAREVTMATGTEANQDGDLAENRRLGRKVMLAHGADLAREWGAEIPVQSPNASSVRTDDRNFTQRIQITSAAGCSDP